VTGYVLKMFPRFSETFILTELLELERRGRSIHVISLKKPDDGRFHGELARVRAAVDYLPEHVRCTPREYLRSHLRAFGRAPSRYGWALVNALGHGAEARKAFLRAPLVVDRAKAAGCSRLHAHFASLPAITAMYAAELSGLPFTFTAHAKDIFNDDRSPRLLRQLMHRAARVVTVSDFNVEFLRALAGPTLAPDRIARVYNGIDLRAFRAEARRAADGAPLILAVGRLVEKKGFDDLIRACSDLRKRGVHARCEIVGKGPLREALQSRIEELDLKDVVQLVGPLPRQRGARRLQQAALLAVPCVVARDGNRDGLPTVIPEAMAAGVPVVATRVTGIPEAIEDGVTGRIVPPGQPRLFASQLEELIGDEGLRSAMGLAGRRRAEQVFDLQRNVDRLDRLIQGPADSVSLAGGPRC